MEKKKFSEYQKHLKEKIKENVESSIDNEIIAATKLPFWFSTLFLVLSSPIWIFIISGIVAVNSEEFPMALVIVMVLWFVGWGILLSFALKKRKSIKGQWKMIVNSDKIKHSLVSEFDFITIEGTNIEPTFDQKEAYKFTKSTDSQRYVVRTQFIDDFQGKILNFDAKIYEYHYTLKVPRTDSKGNVYYVEKQAQVGFLEILLPKLLESSDKMAIVADKLIDKKTYSLKGESLKDMQMENEAFNKKFNTYTNNEAKMNMFLTLHSQESLLKANFPHLRNIEFYTYNQKMIISYSGHLWHENFTKFSTDNVKSNIAKYENGIFNYLQNFYFLCSLIDNFTIIESRNLYKK